jgi:MarR family transcriptional regulator, organic hydroperoxide resistance regulator
MSYEQLKLSNQLCFPMYAASRLITREYQPFLEALGITYPQYLVLMVLWEHGEKTVNDIAQTLLLNTNTITPLLKRMEKMGLIERERSLQDERKILVYVTEKGKDLEEKAASIPIQLIQNLGNSNLKVADLMTLRNQLNELIDFLQKK